MATPGELVKVIAEVLGVPEPTVVVHDRNLVTAGLRSKGGRGRSAARVTPEDAAAILLSILGSTAVKDTVTAHAALASIPAQKCEKSSGRGKQQRYSADMDGRWELEYLPIRALTSLEEGHTFGDALAAIIRAECGGGIDAALNAANSIISDKNNTPSQFGIEIEVWHPENQARIRIFSAHPMFSESIQYYSLDFLHRSLEQSEALGDLGQIRFFSYKTIKAIGRLLSQKDDRK